MTHSILTRWPALAVCCITLALLINPVTAQQKIPSSLEHPIPAGSPSQLLAYENQGTQQAVMLNSWSRGDGVLTFDLGNDGIRFRQGVHALGYTFQGTITGDHLYLANYFSASVLSWNKTPDPSLDIDSQLTLHFPQGSMTIIASHDKWLYMGDRVHGLRVFDISTPGKPILSSWQPEVGAIQAIHASPQRVVVILRNRDALIGLPPEKMDQPVHFHARLATQGPVTLVGDTLYCINKNNTDIYTLPPDGQPRLTATLENVKPLSSPAHNRLLIGARDEATLLDISSPASPKILRTIRFPHGLPPADINLLANDQMVMLDKTNATISLWDIATTHARKIDQIPIMRHAGDIEVASDGTVLLQYNHRDQNRLLSLRIHDKSGSHFTPEQLVLTTPARDSFRRYGVQPASAIQRIAPHLLLISDGLVDISNPQAPRAIHPPTRPAASVQVHHHTATIAQGQRVRILDISKLPELNEVATYNKPEDSKDTFIDAIARDQYAYVIKASSQGNTLQTIDLSDATSPRLLHELPVPSALAMTLHGDTLYIATGTGRTRPGSLHAVSLKNPAQPTLAASVENILQGDCYRIRTWQGRLFLVDDLQGILECDITTPHAPSLKHIYTGDTYQQPAYTDFVIHNNILTATRYSQIVQWNLKP